MERLMHKILVVVDPTASRWPSVEKAARIARGVGAALELYVCDVDQDVPEGRSDASGIADHRARLRARRLETLERLAVPLREAGLTVTTAAEWHAPLEEGIGHHVIRTAPDLVVKDTHWRAAVPRAMLTRTDTNLIRQIPAPLLLVRETEWPRRPLVAVAVDPCHPADYPPALDQAMAGIGRRLGDALDGHVELLHVLQDPPHLPGDKVGVLERAQAHAKARAAVERLAGDSGLAVHYTEGRGLDGLVSLAARREPTVLVMGVASRPRWQHSAGGGTAATVLERAECDLLAVKPPGFVSPLLVTDD
jgi:universal stress protein E